MSEPEADRRRFELELPFYVNGTLADGPRAWMDARLAERPEWAVEVEWSHHARNAVKAARSGVLAEERWASLQTRLIVEGVLPAAPSAQAAPFRDRPRPGRTGWAAALLRPLAVPWPALALGVAVVATQGYLLTHRNPGAGASEGALRYRSASAPSGSCAWAGWLQVAVSPKMPVGEWTTALRTLGLGVMAGPGEGGEWLVRVPAGEDVLGKRQALQAVAGVDEVTVWTPAAGSCP